MVAVLLLVALLVNHSDGFRRQSLAFVIRAHHENSLQVPLRLRGGATSHKNAAGSISGVKPNAKKKRKKKKKKSAEGNGDATAATKIPQSAGGDAESEDEGESVKKTTAVEQTLSEKKKKIAEVLQEDAATALGDAIRDRADQLLSSSSQQPSSNPLLDQIDETVSSVGWALGASDRLSSILQEQKRNNGRNDAEVDEETGGVEASTTAVLVNYFMKSHGGAHFFQCCCSLLAALAGLGAMALPFVHNLVPQKTNGASASTLVVSNVNLVLIRRCLTFAMMKHVSGMLAASVAAARAIPEVGLRKARLWIHDLAKDPVSQYLFYTACVLLWMPSGKSVPRYWQTFATAPACLVGPVVFREWINTLFVLSDVMVLWLVTNQDDSSKSATAAILQRILRLVQGGVDVLMSLLATPKKWKGASAVQRQAILAKLTSRITLLLELVVGVIIVADAVVMSMTIFLASAPAEQRPPFLTLVKTAVCAQLYIQFLWFRRRKITKLATKIRGGAAQLPMYVIDVLMDPPAAMGLNTTMWRRTRRARTPISEMTWKDWMMAWLELD